MVIQAVRTTLLILSLQLLAAAQQSSATIEGVVFGSDKPLADAEVLVVQSSVPSGTAIVPGTASATVVTSVKTDGAGTFVIRDLRPGSYQLFAAHNGYVRQEYGQKSAYRSGTLMLLTAGQALRNIAFTLVPTGSVTGRVNDSNGQPLQGMTVQLLRPAYDSDGRRMLRLVDSRTTNDVGEYRLYWITPGKYYVAADASRSSLEMELRSPSSGVVAGTVSRQIEMDALRSRNEVVDQNFAKAYYINTTDSSQAVAIEVRSGVELPGINLEMPRLVRFHLRGRLVDAIAGSATGRQGSVYLSSLEPGAARLPTTSFDRITGTFEVSNVPAGSYVLDAVMLAANPATTESSVTRMRVDVKGDMDNLEVPIRYGTGITGRVSVEGLASVSDLPGYERIQFSLVSTLLAQSFGKSAEKISTNGSFSFENVGAGEYWFRFTALPPNAYVKSALIGIKDILQDPVVVGTTPPPTMTLTISLKAAQVTGTIVDGGLNPVPGTQVILIPDQLRDHHDRYKTVISDASGQFTFRGIPPGDYRIFAWENLEPYSYFDPMVLEQYESQGKPVHTTESSRDTVSVTVIPVK